MWWWMFSWVRAEDDVWSEACRRAAGPLATDGAVERQGAGWTVRCAGHRWPVDVLPEDEQGRIELLWRLLGAERALRSEGLGLPPLARPQPPAPVPARRASPAGPVALPVQPPALEVPEAPAAPAVPEEPAAPEIPAAVATSPEPAPAIEALVAPALARALEPAPEAEDEELEAIALLPPEAPRDLEMDALPSRMEKHWPSLGLCVWGAATPQPLARRGSAIELRTRRWVLRAGTSRSSRRGTTGAYIASGDAAAGVALPWRALRFEALVGGSFRTAVGFAERTSTLMPVISGDIVGTVPVWGAGAISLLVGGRGEVDLRRTFVVEDEVIEIPRGMVGATIGLAVIPAGSARGGGR